MNAYYDTGAIVPVYLRLKVFRGELAAAEQMIALDRIEAHVGSGRLVLRPVNWIAAFDQARQIAARVTAKTGCRSLDLLHVAVAIQWECCLFVTADDRQLAAAKLQGLETVDLRAPHRRHGAGPSRPGIVKERRAPYGAKR